MIFSTYLLYMTTLTAFRSCKQTHEQSNEKKTQKNAPCLYPKQRSGDFLYRFRQMPSLSFH